MANVETVAGTTISIVAGQPTSFTVAGYEVLSWVAGLIGEITDGGEHGREYAKVEHKPIGNRGTQKFKGSFNEGGKTLQLAIKDDDPGQVVLRAAVLADADYSFRVLYQGGAADYFQAKVMGFKKKTAGVDSIKSATVMLEITTSSTGIGIVEDDYVASPNG